MYTAEKAREKFKCNLDERIEAAVNSSSGIGAHLRVYAEDWFCSSIASELERRGFKNIDVPDIILKGDVYFEW